MLSKSVTAMAFWVLLITDRQTDRQNGKKDIQMPVKHTLLGGDTTTTTTTATMSTMTMATHDHDDVYNKDDHSNEFMWWWWLTTITAILCSVIPCLFLIMYVSSNRNGRLPQCPMRKQWTMCHSNHWLSMHLPLWSHWDQLWRYL